jgi:drug/metabolite transporter (DMT)-like permease
LLFAALSVIWGIPYLLIRVAVRDLSPATLVFARTAPAALALVPLALRRGEVGAVLRRWRWMVAFATIEIAVPWLLLGSAEEHLTSSFSALLVASVPLVAVVLGGALRRRVGRPDDQAGPGIVEKVDARRLAGLGIGLAGVAVLAGVNVRGSNFLSLLEVTAVVVGYASGPLILSRRLSDLPGLGVVSVSFALTAIVYAPWALTHLPRHVTAEVGLSVAGLTVICTAVAFLVFFALVTEVGAVRATVVTYVNPAVALLLGVSVLGEPFTLGLGLGFPLVLAGSVLATGGRLAEPEGRAEGADIAP